MQVREFEHNISGTGSTKAVVAARMGYPSRQAGFSRVSFVIRVSFEYKISRLNVKSQPRHSSYAPYMEQAKPLAVADLFNKIARKELSFN